MCQIHLIFQCKYWLHIQHGRYVIWYFNCKNACLEKRIILIKLNINKCKKIIHLLIQCKDTYIIILKIFLTFFVQIMINKTTFDCTTSIIG